MKFEEVKNNLGKRVMYKDVMHKDREGIYIFSACIIRRRENGYYFQAELLDKVSSFSVFICDLENIQEIGGKE